VSAPPPVPLVARTHAHLAASRLILIEGMIGSGKTTTAERLGDWLSARGLYDRYPFGKLMVPDPQHDWPAALRNIGAAVRP
jgi:hypothetical protein